MTTSMLRLHSPLLFLFLGPLMLLNAQLVVSPAKSGLQIDRVGFDGNTCMDALLGSESFINFNQSSSTFHYKDKRPFIFGLNGVSTTLCKMKIDHFLLFKRFSRFLLRPITNATVIQEDEFICEIKEHRLCDGASDCLTDECSCPTSSSSSSSSGPTNSNIMFCPGGNGCTSFRNICDGYSNCPHASDECLCEDALEISCMGNPHFQKLCLTKYDFCKLYQDHPNYFDIGDLDCTIKYPLGKPVNCTEILAKKKMPANYYKDINPLYGCLLKKHAYITENYYPGMVPEFCKSNCSDLKSESLTSFTDQDCDHFYYEARIGVKFHCTPFAYSQEYYRASSVCDGKLDCRNGADELKCPGRFYCSSEVDSIFWIPISKVCDHSRDCDNGKDECDCTAGTFSSSKDLLKSKMIGLIIFTSGLLVIIINIQVAYDTYKTKHSTKAGKIDKILRIQICFYDCLMGIYMVVIVIALITQNYDGTYCLKDEIWRSSTACTILGLLFSISSHGSLLMISMMSVIRCIKCTYTFVEMSIRSALYFSVIISVVNVMHAFVPVIPLASVQNIFRTAILLKSVAENPFFAHAGELNVSHLRKIHGTYYNTKPSSDLHQIVQDLRNITSKTTIFDVTDINYYGNTPLCIWNLFKNHENFKSYKLAYCSVLTGLLLVVSSSYIIILVKAWKSSKAVQNQEAAAASLTVKVAIMIGSQLAAWLSLIATAINYTQSSPSLTLFYVFALIVIPVNSLLNPLFYSGLYNRFATFIWHYWRNFVARGHPTEAIGEPAYGD